MTLELLFKLRAAVGRFGEMDCAGWWNTQDVLGARGAAVYKRGQPRTHLLARVRVVSAVAAERSRTIYPAADVITLWRLPAAVERSLSFHERSWATNGTLDEWSSFESGLTSPVTDDLAGWLSRLGLLDEDVTHKGAALAAEPGGKGVAVPGPLSDEAIQLLAVGHSRGSPKNLVVPFIRNEVDGALG